MSQELPPLPEDEQALFNLFSNPFETIAECAKGTPNRINYFKSKIAQLSPKHKEMLLYTFIEHKVVRLTDEYLKDRFPNHKNHRN